MSRVWVTKQEKTILGTIGEWKSWSNKMMILKPELFMKKAMCAWLHPVQGKENEWTWDKAESIFIDSKTNVPTDWRTSVLETAEVMDWKLYNYDFSSIYDLASLAMSEPTILVPDLCILEKYKGFINKMPSGAIVMGDIDEVPTVLIWEEDLIAEPIMEGKTRG